MNSSLSCVSLQQAISQGQTLLIPTTRSDEDSDLSDTPPLTYDGSDNDSSIFSSGTTASQIHALLQSLQRNLNWDKKENRTSDDAEHNRPLEILEEEEEESEEGLEIAWQYRKSIQQERLGHGGSANKSPAGSGGSLDLFCHSYDLSGRMKEQRNVEESVTIFNGSCCELCCKQSRSCGIKLYQCWLVQVKERLAESKQVIRLLLYLATILPAHQRRCAATACLHSKSSTTSGNLGDYSVLDVAGWSHFTASIE